MKKLLWILAFAATGVPAYGQVIEDFNDGAAASRWTVVSSEEVNTYTNAETSAVTEITAPPDFQATLNFDYSIINLIPGRTIPTAPNTPAGDTTTIGAFFQSNLVNYEPQTFTNTIANPDFDPDDNPNNEPPFIQQEQTIFEGAGVGAFFKDFELPPEFSFKADMFYLQTGLGGSTEWASLGVHHLGSEETPVPFVGDGDGLGWTTSTDTDTSFNLRSYQAPPGGPSDNNSATVFGRDYNDIPEGTIPGVPTGDDPMAGIMNRWVTFEVTRVGDAIKWFINGTLVDEQDGAALSGGSILIGNADSFDSVSPSVQDSPFIFSAPADFDAFVAAANGLAITNGAIFDNIVIAAIPEPATGTILFTLMSLCGISTGRSRRS